jgi:hypothetical protein
VSVRCETVLHLTGQLFVKLVGRGRQYGRFTVCFNF